LGKTLTGRGVGDHFKIGGKRKNSAKIQLHIVRATVGKTSCTGFDDRLKKDQVEKGRSLRPRKKGIRAHQLRREKQPYGNRKHQQSGPGAREGQALLRQKCRKKDKNKLQRVRGKSAERKAEERTGRKIEPNRTALSKLRPE